MSRYALVYPTRSRQLWDPFGRRRIKAEPVLHRALRHWFWPLPTSPNAERIAARRKRWAHLRDTLRGTGEPVETKSRSLTGWRWPDFTPAEMSCRHCGEPFLWPAFLDALQAARDRVGRPFRILSAHRCSLHNARVGGAPLSQHLRLAVDIALAGHDRNGLLSALRSAGFTGFGFYRTYLHADMGPARQWYGSQGARTLWQA